tara:strand:+ start:2055 stop:2282 length:228 start_codon:yes stop_codon:yes gene_type:complete
MKKNLAIKDGASLDDVHKILYGVHILDNKLEVDLTEHFVFIEKPPSLINCILENIEYRAKRIANFLNKSRRKITK